MMVGTVAGGSGRCWGCFRRSGASFTPGIVLQLLLRHLHELVATPFHAAIVNGAFGLNLPQRIRPMNPPWGGGSPANVAGPERIVCERQVERGKVRFAIARLIVLRD